LDLNVVASDGTSELKTYDYNFILDGNTKTISPIDAPLFKSGVNTIYVMNKNDFNLLGDGNVQNTTPSLMSKLTLTFDKPTTTYTINDQLNQKILTFTCTNGTTSNCTNTYITINGITYTNQFEFTLKGVGTYNISYYSTGTNNNTETTQTFTETITATQITQSGVSSGCQILNGFSLYIIGIIAILGFMALTFFTTKDLAISVLITTFITIVLGAVIMIFGANIVGIACKVALGIA